MEIMEITTKVCSKCKVEKPCNLFYVKKAIKGGLDSSCKECKNQYYYTNKVNRRQYLNDKKDDISKKKKDYYLSNKKKFDDYAREYIKNRLKKDSLFRLIANLRYSVRFYCKAIRANKTTRTKDMLGLDLSTFKSYMESKFQDGMTWENYGQWHVDHIKPISLARNEKEIIELNHYTNLQPLWASENFKKSNKYEEAQHGNYGESFV
jgi:hypothetical protein